MQKAIFVHVRRREEEERIRNREFDIPDTERGQEAQDSSSACQSWKHVQEGSMAPRSSTSLPEEEEEKTKESLIYRTLKGAQRLHTVRQHV